MSKPFFTRLAHDFPTYDSHNCNPNQRHSSLRSYLYFLHSKLRFHLRLLLSILLLLLHLFRRLHRLSHLLHLHRYHQSLTPSKLQANPHCLQYLILSYPVPSHPTQVTSTQHTACHGSFTTPHPPTHPTLPQSTLEATVRTESHLCLGPPSPFLLRLLFFCHSIPFHPSVSHFTSILGSPPLPCRKRAPLCRQNRRG